MAIGDILSATIIDDTDYGIDGCFVDIVIEGFVDGGTVDFGLGANNDPSTAKFVMTVVSEGYTGETLGTVTRTLYGTKIVRKSDPNYTDREETESGGNLTVRVALSGYVYDDDKDGGAGTSGTDPTLTIAADWYTDDGVGGSSGGSNAVTDLTVTNNSTLDYPKVLARWDFLGGAMPADRLTSDFNLAAFALSRYGIAAVRFDADGQSSANNETETVTETSTQEYPATGIYREHYKTAPLDLSGFTDSELVHARFRAYPVVGDANSVRDTEDVTAATHEVLGYSRSVMVANPSDDGDLFAVVAGTGTGTDPGVVSSTLATAEASPFATIGAAVASTANVIYLEEGEHDLGSGEIRRSSNEWIRITRHPFASKEFVTVRMSTDRDYNCERFSLEDMTLRKASTSSWLDGEEAGNFVRLRNLTFDDNGVGQPTVGPGYKSHACYIQGCDGDGGDALWDFGAFSSSRVAYSFEGNDWTGSLGKATYLSVGNKFSGILFNEGATSNAAPAPVDCWVGWNIGLDITAASDPQVQFGGTRDCSGLALVSNLIEVAGGVSTPVFKICADSSTFAASNVVCVNNTIYGERLNWCYNDEGTQSNVHANVFRVGNIESSYNTKHDAFLHPVDGRSGLRVGGWAIVHDVGCEGNFTLTSAGGGPPGSDPTDFTGDFGGLNSVWGGTVGFVDDNSAITDGSGNGDYHLGGSSDAIALLPNSLLRFDIEGNERSSSGTAAGVYRYSGEAASPSVVVVSQAGEGIATGGVSIASIGVEQASSPGAGDGEGFQSTAAVGVSIESVSGNAEGLGGASAISVGGSVSVASTAGSGEGLGNQSGLTLGVSVASIVGAGDGAGAASNIAVGRVVNSLPGSGSGSGNASAVDYGTNNSGTVKRDLFDFDNLFLGS